MSDGALDQINFQSCGGTMKINTIGSILSLAALVVFSGCNEDESTGKKPLNPPLHVKETDTNLKAETSMPAGGCRQASTVAVDSSRLEVERILADDLSSIPMCRRYRTQRDRERELWKYLVRIQTNDAVYVICAVARLQAQWEHDLATIRIPERKVPREPIRRTPEGLYYSIYTNRAKLKLVKQETREIDDTKGYLTQLRYYVEEYTNGVDSEYLWSMYRSLDENTRRKVMARMISILGRSPRWERWQS